MSMVEHIVWLREHSAKASRDLNRTEVMSHLLAIQAELEKPGTVVPPEVFAAMDDDLRLITMQGFVAVFAMALGEKA